MVFHGFKNLVEILLVFFSLLIIDDFFESIKMIILEGILFKSLKLSGAKWAPMMPINSLLDAVFAVNMPTPSDVAICDPIEANGALKLSLQQFCTDFKLVLVFWLYVHDDKVLLICNIITKLDYHHL